MAKKAVGGAKRGRKRTEAQREADFGIVSSGLKAGRDFKEIAEQISNERSYSLTHWQVKEDAKVVLGRWRDSHIFEIEEMKLIELARLNRVEAQAWAAWERSMSNYMHGSKTSKTLAAAPNGKASVKEETTSQRTGTRVGDPRFLQIIQDCGRDRRRLFALDPKDPDLGTGEKAIGVTMVFKTGKTAEQLTSYPVKRLTGREVKVKGADEDEGEFLEEDER